MIGVTMVTRLALPLKPGRALAGFRVTARETKGPGVDPAGTVGTMGNRECGKQHEGTL